METVPGWNTLPRLFYSKAVAYRQHAGEPYHFAVMSYDERGRMEAVVHYTENLGFDAVYYTYNSMNMITSVRVVDPQRQYTTWYGYNANGHIDSVWTKLSAVGTGLGVANPMYRQPEARDADADIAYSYTKRWQVATMAYPPIDAVVRYAYNGRQLLDSLIASRNGSVLFRQVLSYEPEQSINRQQWQHQGHAEKVHHYVYDERQRLTAAYDTMGTYLRSYLYDAVGNRLYSDALGQLTEILSEFRTRC